MKYSEPQPSPACSESNVQAPVVISQLDEGTAAKAIADSASRIAKRIKQWVGADPELTKILCDCVVRSSPKVDKSNPEAIVDSIVEKEIGEGWAAGVLSAHLNRIEKVIMQSSRKDSALILYIQVLQRKKVSVNEDPGRELLESSGLVKVEDGCLMVANALYAKAFDLKKVEEMLPGITKPVKIISLAEARDEASSSALSLYSKWALAACVFAIVVTSISSYIRVSGGSAMATSSETSGEEQSLVAKAPATPSNSDAATPNAVAASETNATNRELFDRGEEHAINSRWVLMMREFCNISETSMYYAPAKKEVEQLFKLYSEDIQLARDIVRAEKGSTCSM